MQTNAQAILMWRRLHSWQYLPRYQFSEEHLTGNNLYSVPLKPFLATVQQNRDALLEL